MTNPIRWKQRFQNFEKALTVFKDRCSDVNEHPKGSKYHDAFQMALVQAFEIILELSWKVLKDYLENEGYTEVQTGKRALRQAFQDGMIENGEAWLRALEMRNHTSHIYDVSILEELNSFVVESFLPEVEKLHNTLKAEL
ncbi:nucleotidyltransferase substrate binding protein [Treponema sp. OMZ 787]|uniref:HI0074 family nucleotidyltransferase substrate-binding subunit n=1 Tax=Treponema sp. OMZ 787 TaxID=2563669 RepID=UPI0020A5505C|nr:HI0074 family nucleotidyltransferase substrate-binding subunit [Treponema sp. OMZ 787]UTC61616.1 nucleotidyltransferase substrate binding protein [Treponema sp. OMZ 787]